MGVSNKYRKNMCAIAEQVLANGESLSAICAELEITRTTLYDWRNTHPEFKEAIERGLQKAQRLWEKMGQDGIKGHYEKFNAAPWIFTMKNRFRDDYSEDKETKNDMKAIFLALVDKLVE